MNINESDWKIWKALRLRCIDEFCQETFDKVQKLDDAEGAIHDRHRKLYQLVTDRDRDIEVLFDPMKRSAALMQLINLYRCNRISDDDVTQFSEELRTFLQNRKSL